MGRGHHNSPRGPKPTSGNRRDPSVVVTARIPQSVRDALVAMAQEKGQKLSVFLRELLTDTVGRPGSGPGAHPPPQLVAEPTSKQSHPGTQTTLPLLNEYEVVDWRTQLFTAHQDAVGAGNAIGHMVALDVLAHHLGWHIGVVRRRIKRARLERWAICSHPIQGVDDFERANITAPPTGARLLHAVAVADLSVWISTNPGDVSRLGIEKTRLQTLLERRATPARWERQRFKLVVDIPTDAWPCTSPGKWTRERAIAALRDALPHDDIVRAEAAQRCHTQPPTLERWASGTIEPQKHQRNLLEHEFGIPARAWKT